MAIINCESGGQEGKWGDCDDTGIEDEFHCKAFGVAQFWEETFIRHARLAKLEHADRESTQDQLTLLRWALQPGHEGYAREWSCWRRLQDTEKPI